MPPLTCIVSPVIYEAESEAKNATVLATSSPVPNFDIGIREVNAAFIFSKYTKLYGIFQVLCS